MTDRDDVLRRALAAAAAPRPLAPATRDRLAALVRDDADARVAALLRGAATPRALRAPVHAGLRARLATGVPARAGLRARLATGVPARAGLRARLATGVPVRVPADRVRPRVTPAAVAAAAAAVVLVATAVVRGPVSVPAPVARPAPTVGPTAPPGASEQPPPAPLPPPTTLPPPSATGTPDAGEVPAPVAPPGSSAPTGTTPPAEPRPGEEPAGAPAAPNDAGKPGGGAQPQRGISRVQPDVGPLAGGTVITVRGTGLSSVVRVEVGGRRAGSLTVESDSEVTAHTPAAARAGHVPVVVVMADGARYGLSPGFTYVAVPVVEAISPDRGPTAGGNTVVLSGYHFRADAVVRFGTARAEVREVSPTSIEVVAPAHVVGTVDVTVTTPGGTSAGRRYTYLPA